MSFLRSLVKSPITWALAIWAIDVFGWIPFWSAHVNPFLSHVFSPYYGLADWWGSVKSLISMMAGQIVMPFLLWLFVVRRFYRQKVLIYPTQPSRFRLPVTVVLMIVFYLLFIPARAVLYPSVLIMGIAFLGVGFFEEWSYRVVLIRVLRDRIGWLLAAVMSAILFVLSHQTVASFSFHVPLSAIAVPTFLIAMALAVMVWRTGSVIWAAFVHGIYDWSVLLRGSQPDTLILVLLAGLMGAEILRFFSRPQLRSG